MTSSQALVVLRIADLTLHWPDGAPLFSALNTQIGAGVTLLQGDSGSGKTTLLRLIAGDLVASGRIALHGRTREDDRGAWDRDVAFADADDAGLDGLTPDAVMARMRTRHGMLDERAWERHLDGFALQPHRAKPLFQLSTGSRRKVLLAALLAARPLLTLLDEPGAGLDAASLRHLRTVLDEADADPTRAVLLVASFGLEALGGSATVCLGTRESA